jgi:hypothetical protein
MGLTAGGKARLVAAERQKARIAKLEALAGVRPPKAGEVTTLEPSQLPPNKLCSVRRPKKYD